MTASARLRWVAVLIIISALYAVLVSQDPEVASAFASGYVAGILTVLLVVNVWKRP